MSAIGGPFLKQMQTYKRPDKADILFPGTSKEQSQKKLTECTEDQQQLKILGESLSDYEFILHS